MELDVSLSARVDELRERIRRLEDGIRMLQARLAAWDRGDDERRTRPVREAALIASAEARVEP